MDANQIAKRIAAKRFRKPQWALDWEADAFEEFRNALLSQVQDAGTVATESAKARLRALYRVIRAGSYQHAFVACCEAAVVITWDMRARGGDHNQICTFSAWSTLDEPGDIADDEFSFAYLGVRKAYY